MSPTRPELHRLVSAARDGDERAWEQLVPTLTPLLARVARSYRLNRHDAEDVIQLTWLRLLRNIRGLDDPSAVRAWLITTARREALRRLEYGRRELPVNELAILDGPDGGAMEEDVLERERRDALRAAMRDLPPRQRALLDALSAEPAPAYEVVAARLGIPIGSIGPTRARSLDRLRRDPRLVLLVG
jgi:RNA polymerase sigma factor (sigma-70 family)